MSPEFDCTAMSMSYVADSGGSDTGELATTTTAPKGLGAAASKRWRSLWRLHFYSGMFAMPFILFMAFTGLIILYTQPLHSLLSGDRYNVAQGASTVPYEVQAQAAQARFPEATLTGVVTPRNATTASVFSLDDGSGSGQQVFVNPYSGKVLGTEKPGSGIVGLANRLHGFMNVSSVKVSLPTVSAFWDHEKIMRNYVVGDIVLEVLGVWTLVLVMSGLYLWWQRRSRTATTKTKASGRAKLRNAHSLSGVLLFGAMFVTIISGLGWSRYWGPNFSALANKVTPNLWTDAPPSALGTRGDLDVLGNQIPWNTGERPIPASYATPGDGVLPAPVSLNFVATQAANLGMKPGFTINFPKNVTDEKTSVTTYGSFTLSNSWPRKTNEARDLHLDQFSGRTLAEQNSYGYGAVSYGLDVLVSNHMGTQIGVFSRIMMTMLCVLSIW